MLRGLGAVMIILGCTGMGLWYRGQFLGRVKVLKELEGILHLFAGEIRYGRATLPECCRVLAGQVEKPYSDCLWSIYEQMLQRSGDSFAEVYRECMEECLKSTPLTADDRKLMVTLFGREDFMDCGMQLQTVERRQEAVNAVIDELERELKGKCKVAVGLGVMSGLLLVIVLI